MKVAILPPPLPDLGWIWRLRALSSLLVDDVSRELDEQITVAVGLPGDGSSRWERLSCAVKAQSPFVGVRKLVWETVAAEHARRIHGDAVELESVEQFATPRDGGWNFADCTAWIVAADERLGAVLPSRPTSFYCRDLGSRYASGELAASLEDPLWERQLDAFASWRKAVSVLTSDPGTRTDLTSYAGVRSEKIILAPPLWSRAQADGAVRGRYAPPGLLWFVGQTARHRPEAGLEALESYVEAGGDLPITIAAERPEMLDPRRGFANAFTRALARNPELLSRIAFRACADLEALARISAGAAVIWSSSIFEGEPDLLRLACRFRKDWLSPDYPQARRLAAVSHGFAALYPADDPQAAAGALLRVDDAWRAGERGSGDGGEQAQEGDGLALAWAEALELLAGHAAP